jgi:NADH-quinone oxidoreductase subunit C
MERLTELADRVRERIPEPAVFSTEAGLGIEVLVSPATHLVDVLQIARDEFGFEMLTDVCAVDWLPREPRYDVNYHLLSLDRMERLRVKVPLPDDDEPKVPSAVAVYPGANWHEREVYDFFGIVFTGHPDLRRILMPEEWIGHPLRKDYPVGGVPVEYRIEPAYIGPNLVPADSRPAAGGVPVRLRRDRGRLSHMTWTGPPASGVGRKEPGPPAAPSEEGEEG